MKKTFQNVKMAEMTRQLQPVLSQRNKVGYAAARNFRVLSTALTEYDMFRRELIEKYGTPDLDENGNEVGTVTLQMGTPAFKQFLEEMKPYDTVEQEVELMMVKYDEVIGVLSGEEIVGIDWMLED